MSGCCPFPREPAQTRVHIHTHGRCRRPHQASVCPHSHLLPRPPGFQARSSHGLSHPRSLPPLPQSWSPAPPGCSGPVPPQGGLAGWGPAVGGQPPWGPAEARAPAPVPGQAGLALRTPGPPVGCSTESWIPRNAFGKDLFLNTKSAPPASCGNPTFCSPAFWSPRLSSVHRSVCLSAPSYPGGNSVGERGRKE